MYEILVKEMLTPVTKFYEVRAPAVARKARAGQFVIVRIHEKGERIPLTVADYNRERGTISLVVQEVGKTTMQMGAMEVGQQFASFTGPLGRPTEIRRYGIVLCIGGGFAIAPIYPIARALRKAGNTILCILGVRTHDLLFWEDRMRLVSDELIVCTDDGSYGRKGFVTEALKDVLDKGDTQLAVAIGPVPMMKFVSKLTAQYGVKTIVSLNPIMVDGTGMCGGCRVTVGGKTKFACVDGPEFDGHQVDYDELMRRLQAYCEDEKRCFEDYCMLKPDYAR